MRVPFGWHEAPRLVQRLIATVVGHLDLGTVIILQYLDGILLMGKSEVQSVTAFVATEPKRVGFLIGVKSILTPVFEVDG